MSIVSPERTATYVVK